MRNATKEAPTAIVWTECFYSRFNVDTGDRDSGGLRTIGGSGLKLHKHKLV